MLPEIMATPLDVTPEVIAIYMARWKVSLL